MPKLQKQLQKDGIFNWTAPGNRKNVSLNLTRQLRAYKRQTTRRHRRESWRRRAQSFQTRQQKQDSRTKSDRIDLIKVRALDPQETLSGGQKTSSLRENTWQPHWTEDSRSSQNSTMKDDWKRGRGHKETFHLGG